MVPIFVVVFLGIYSIWAVRKIYKDRNKKKVIAEIVRTDKLESVNKNVRFAPNGIAFLPNGTNTGTSVDGAENNSIMESR